MWPRDKAPTARCLCADVRGHGGAVSFKPVLRLTWWAGAVAEVALGCELVHHEEMLDYVELLGVDAGPASSYIVSVRMSPQGTVHKTQVRVTCCLAGVDHFIAVTTLCHSSLLSQHVGTGAAWLH